MKSRSTWAALCGCAVFLLSGAQASAAGESSSPWVAAWATAIQPIPERTELPALYRAPDVAARTVRQIVYPTLSGHSIRLHLSNAYGKTPLAIEAMRVGRSAGGGAALAGGDGVPVTFLGKAAVSVPPGASVESDPVVFDVERGRPVAVSAYLGRDQRIAAWHRVSSQLSFISGPGDHTADPQAAAFKTRFTQFVWLDGMSVQAPGAMAIAAIGDSITDGMRSTLDRNQRWPDAFARRLAADGHASTAVLNLGISGNRLLSDSPCYGDALAKRFERDALTPSGVRSAIVLIGINDINFAGMPPHGGLDCDFPHTQVTADDLIAGYKRLIAEAHRRGVRIYGATLTPAALPATREAIRSAVNQWIRAGRAFDGVVDFDAALRDPADPTRLRREFDSGDHIHPSDRGYTAMAEAIPVAAVVDFSAK